MFLGEFYHVLDKKNRLFIPSKFRKKAFETFIITCGLEGCLFVYPKPTWEKITGQLAALPVTKKASREFMRAFLSGASEEKVDKQGRLIISRNLISFSGLDKEAVIIGVGDRVEIWARNRWEKYRNGAYKRYSSIAERLDI